MKTQKLDMSRTLIGENRLIEAIDHFILLGFKGQLHCHASLVSEKEC